jgi:hypothetical protein
VNKEAELMVEEEFNETEVSLASKERADSVKIHNPQAEIFLSPSVVSAKLWEPRKHERGT